MIRFAGAGLTDVGLVRPHNEDSGFVGCDIALVADGVGGAASGEVASATAARVAYAVAARLRGTDAGQVLAAVGAAAQEAVRREVQRDLSRLGMATTLTMVVTDGVTVVLGHVGDSRAYRWRAGDLVRVSTDHTYVQRLVEEGRLSRDEIPEHPWRNIVLRSVDGDPDSTGIDVVMLQVDVGDRLLLCSDGLSDMVPEPLIAEVLALAPEAAVPSLVQAARAAGGRDNITVVVLEIQDVATGTTDPGADGVWLGAAAEVAAT